MINSKYPQTAKCSYNPFGATFNAAKPSRRNSCLSQREKERSLWSHLMMDKSESAVVKIVVAAMKLVAVTVVVLPYTPHG